MENQCNGGKRKESSLRRGPWTKEEDHKLLSYVRQHGHGSWRSVPAKAGLQRCGKSCRLRWTNYLRPGIKRGNFSAQEEKDILRLHALLGNRWSAIAAQLPRRTDNDVKNYWTLRLKKKLTRMGIDPVTHKPKHCATGAGTVQSKQIAELSHMAQWETTRLEAEARLVRESKLHLRRNVARAANLTPPLKLHLAPRCLDVLKVWEATASHNGFFSPTPSSTSLESPASTLNFPATAPVASDVVFSDACGLGNADNKAEVVHDGGAAAAGNCSELDPIGDMDFSDSDYLQMLEENMDYWSSVLGELLD